jgi:hypothetical protein
MRAPLALGLALAGLIAAGVASAEGRSPSSNPSRLLVSGEEYRIRLSRGAVKPGPALIQFVNRGEDPHDLRLKRIGASATRAFGLPELRPGGLVQLETRLRTGRYRLWCSLPGHEQRGMRAVLSVRRSREPQKKASTTNVQVRANADGFRGGVRSWTHGS